MNLTRRDAGSVLLPGGLPPKRLRAELLANLSLIVLDEREPLETQAEEGLALAPLTIIVTPGESEQKPFTIKLPVHMAKWLKRGENRWREDVAEKR